MGRMAADAQRVHEVAYARQGKLLDAPGAHDERWRRKRAAELAEGEDGPAIRHGVRGCACCHPPVPPMAGVCELCSGWQQRGRRGRVALPLARPGCVNSTPCRACEGGWSLVSHNFAERRRLRCPLPAPDGVPSAAAASRQRGGGGAPWQGFAGLPQTVVERLLEEGAGVGLPADTATAECLADVRHVMGGGCCAGERYEAALADVAAGVAEAARHVCAAGGGGSELSHVLERAHACVDGGRERRLARPASDWEALRCVLACAVPAPVWLAS